MKKRITLKDWTHIGIYNPAAKWLRPIASYTLEEIDGGFRRECKVPMWLYLIIFIPLHLLQALWCMWDGGLREFTIEGRHIGYDNIREHGENSGAYLKAKEIWEKYK